jgi:hypothetical protein
MELHRVAKPFQKLDDGQAVRSKQSAKQEAIMSPAKHEARVPEEFHHQSHSVF